MLSPFLHAKRPRRDSSSSSISRLSRISNEWIALGGLRSGRWVDCFVLRAYAQLTGFRIRREITNRESEGIVKDVREPRFSEGIPKSHLKLIDDDPKAELFRNYLPMPKEDIGAAEELLERLKKLSPVAAGSFKLRSGDLDSLTFRLVFPHPFAPPRIVKGYYALSYRWRSGPRIHNHTVHAKQWPSRELFMASPVSDIMFEAIMDELPGDDWGLWCDQLCINETDEEERSRVVGMMDIVYKRANKVIIALDDILIDGEDEIAALEEFSDWHEHHSSQGRVPEDEDLDYMKTRPKLRKCAEKIVYSEYFDRAWCGHEFELANDRLMLIRAGKYRDSEKQRIVRIPYDKLHTLMLLLSLNTGHDLTPEQINRRVNVELLISRSDRNDPTVRSPMVHDMQTLALINSMNTGGDPTLPDKPRAYSAINDKLSIMLNACEFNLQPQNFKNLQALELKYAKMKTYQDISLLMLASGNPLVLTTSGPPIRLNDNSESWMRKFWLLDAGVDTPLEPLKYPPLNVEVENALECRWVRLNMLFPRNGGKINVASEKYLHHATTFVKDYYEHHQEDIIKEDKELMEIRMDHLVHSIACVLECRPRWSNKMVCMGKREANMQPWQYFFGDNFDELPLPIGGGGGNNNNNNNNNGGDRGAMRLRARSKSPRIVLANAFARRASRSSSRGSKSSSEQRTALEMAGELMSNLLMTAPLPESRGDPGAWRPAWFEIGETGQRYIVMAPREAGRYRIAVPEVLKTASYAGLPRCWILEEKDGAPEGNWIVRNRSKLIMEGDTLEPDIEKGTWWCEKKQTIWGRTVADTAEDGGEA